MRDSRTKLKICRNLLIWSVCLVLPCANVFAALDLDTEAYNKTEIQMIDESDGYDTNSEAESKSETELKSKSETETKSDQETEDTQVTTEDQESEKSTDETMLESESETEEVEVRTSTFGIRTTSYVNTPLGGNAIKSGDESKLVIMEASGSPTAGYYAEYASTAANVSVALTDLYNEADADPGKSYIMYIGTNIGSVAATVFANSDTPGTFAALTGKVDTLVLTGLGTDTISDTPVTSAPSTVKQFLPANTNSYFGCNIIIRNIQHNFGTNVYMNGYNLTLGGNSWQTSATSYYSGSDSGTVAAVNGTVNMTVYSTGTGYSYFYGGMYQGTLQGNSRVTINNTSGNIIRVWGGGEGTSTTNTANVTGDVTTTITGMATTGSSGLDRFVGGVEYGNIDGKITNTISGLGRLNQTNPGDGSGVGQFFGGCAYGNVGGGGSAGAALYTGGIVNQDYSALLGSEDYAIKNNIDFSNYTAGRMYYHGANYRNGTVTGNIINIVKAGDYSTGGAITGFVGGASSAVTSGTVGGNWRSTFTTNASNGTISNAEAATVLAENNLQFKQYGNIVNVLRSGCFAGGETYTRGAGYGFMVGNVYTEVGTEGMCYRQNNNSYTPSSTVRTQGYSTTWDFVGGGGTVGGQSETDFFIIGDTTLVTRNIIARWTYGGNFGGGQIGDSYRIHTGGVVDTCEGAGYQNGIHIGSSYAEVAGGQVDWFLSGGGWNDAYQDGDTSVVVRDVEGTIINASMGGTYGNSATHYISGDSTVVIYGGNFSGTPRTGPRGFSAGPTNRGRIFGNASVTIDLRGNQHGFQVGAGDNICGGRSIGADGSCYLGYDENNTIELNILTDAGSDLLNGLNIYGDSGTSGTSSNTRSGSITININAAGSNIGNLYATNYSNLSGGRLLRDVEINLVSAESISGLSAGNGTDNITNAVASNSAAAGKNAVINIGPQDEDSTGLLGDRETEATADGLPHTISVTGSSPGINGFTEMNINKRLLTASAGSIRNGNGATVALHRSDYNSFGHVTLQAGEGSEASGIGIEGASASFIAGNLIVNGEGTVYIQSVGARDQVVFSDVTMSANSTVSWLKVGSEAIKTGFTTNWFGASSGWYVMTFNPTKSNAEKMTPFILEGFEKTTGKTFIGDNETSLSSTDGYAIAIPGSVYTWNVTEGYGMVTHNVENVYNEEVKPSSYISVYGTVAAGVPSRSGKLVIPSEVVPDTIDYPKFSFIPDVPIGEWVKGVQIHCSDEYNVSPTHSNCIDIEEQSIEDYIEKSVEECTLTWQTGEAEKLYSYDMKVQFTNDVEIYAYNVLITESEAAEITEADDLIRYNEAMGRPFFEYEVTDELIEAISQPLDEGERNRVHTVTYSAGTTGNSDMVTVNIVVVKDETVISENRKYGVYAKDAVMKLYFALAIANQEDLDGEYTEALAILADGTTAIPEIDSGAISAINGTVESEIPKNVPVSYTYAPDAETSLVRKDVTVTIIDNGTLRLVVSEEANYGTHGISPNTEDYWVQAFELGVIDDRITRQTWILTAKLEQPFTLAGGGHTLTNALVYTKAGTEYTLGSSATTISSRKNIDDNLFDIYAQWSMSGEDGLFIRVAPGALKAGTYTAVIRWELSDVP